MLREKEILDNDDKPKPAQDFVKYTIPGFRFGQRIKNLFQSEEIADNESKNETKMDEEIWRQKYHEALSNFDQLREQSFALNKERETSSNLSKEIDDLREKFGIEVKELEEELENQKRLRISYQEDAAKQLNNLRTENESVQSSLDAKHSTYVADLTKDLVLKEAELAGMISRIAEIKSEEVDYPEILQAKLDEINEATTVMTEQAESISFLQRQRDSVRSLLVLKLKALKKKFTKKANR